MNIFVIEDFYVQDINACNFYTVRFDSQLVSETDKFYDRFFQEDGGYYEDIQDIHALIEQVGERGLRLIRRVRDEAKVNALPPERVIAECEIEVFGNNLRLYYVELAHNVVVLLGGGIAHDAQDGRPPIQFGEAQSFAKKILEATNIFFEVSDGYLVSLGGEEIIIY